VRANTKKSGGRGKAKKIKIFLMKSKKINIVTLGCPKNVVDSEKVLKHG